MLTSSIDHLPECQEQIPVVECHRVRTQKLIVNPETTVNTSVSCVKCDDTKSLAENTLPRQKSCQILIHRVQRTIIIMRAKIHDLNTTKNRVLSETEHNTPRRNVTERKSAIPDAKPEPEMGQLMGEGRPTTVRVYLVPFDRYTWERACMPMARALHYKKTYRKSNFLIGGLFLFFIYLIHKYTKDINREM